QKDEVAPRRKRAARGTKCFLRVLNLYAALQQELLQLDGSQWVLLIGRDHIRERRHLLAGLDRASAQVVEIPDQVAVVGRRRAEQTADGAQVVLDDVAERPAASWPWMWSADTASLIRRGLGDRRRDLDVRGFGQQADDVVAERRRVLISR